jgi:hypothetical protein
LQLGVQVEQLLKNHSQTFAFFVGKGRFGFQPVNADTRGAPSESDAGLPSAPVNHGSPRQ